MHKLLLTLFLIITSIIVFGQEETDSTYFDEEYSKDTTATFHFGFTVGGVFQGLLYSENKSNFDNDSVKLTGTTPQTGFCVGVILDKDFGEKLWLRTGVLLNISKLNLQYEYKDKENYTFSYSTLEIPIWLQYAFKNKRKGLSWGAGVKGTIDISKKSDRALRTFKLNKYELMLGTGPAMRWELPSHSMINAQLAFNIGLLNIFDKADNIHSRAVDSGQRWQIQLLLSLN